MGRNYKNVLLGLATTAVAFTSCQKSAEEESVAASKVLYVSSGACNSGVGVTTYTAATASRAITKWNTSTGLFISSVIDWNSAAGFANSVPQQVIDEGDSLLILADNNTTFTERKVFRVDKDNLGVFQTVVPQAWSAAPASVAGHINRSFQKDAKGQLTIVRSSSIERTNSLGALIPGPTAAATAYANPAAVTGTCVPGTITIAGTVTAGGTFNIISDAFLLEPSNGQPNGKIIFSNAGALLAINRISATIQAGLTTATTAHCAGTSQITTTTHTYAPDLGTGNPTFDANGPSITSMIFIATPAPATTTGKIIVAYAPSNSAVTAQYNTTNLNHAIVMWDVTETSAIAVSFTNPIVLANDDTVVIAPSAMAYDSSTSTLWVAVGPAARNVSQSGGNQGYNIEKFTLDMTTPKLTRVHNNFQPFVIGNAQTKCISGLTIGN